MRMGGQTSKGHCPLSVRMSKSVRLCRSPCGHREREMGRGCVSLELGTQCLWKGDINGPSFFSPGPSLTWLLDLAVGHLHGGWCLREGIEHGEAAISQARGGGIHHCMGTRVHHVATHSCGNRRRHDGGGQRHWKTQTHIRELIPPGISRSAPGCQPSGSLYHVLWHKVFKSLFFRSLSTTTIKPNFFL